MPKVLQPTLAPKREASLKGGDQNEPDEHEEAVDDTHLGGDTALKFLLAGGVAGAGTECLLYFYFFLRSPRLTAQNQCRGRPLHRLIVSECSSSRALRTSTHSRRTPSCTPNAVCGPSAGQFSRYMRKAVLLGFGSGMASILPRSSPYVPTCFMWLCCAEVG